MHWRDDFANGLLSYLSMRLLGDCSAGWPGQIILPTVCFHDQRFAGWPGQVILPKVCFLLLSFFIPDECFAGWLGQIILPQVFFLFLWLAWPDQVCFRFFFPNSDGLDAMTHVCLHVFSCLSQMIPWLDGLATTFWQRLVYVSFHLSPTSLRCSTACCHVFSFASQMSAFLGGLARSFCQMFAFISFPMYPR